MGFYARTAEGAFPISIADLKQFAKVDTDADDAVITRLMRGVVTAAEGYTGRELRANTYVLTLEDFSDPIELRRSPVASITDIEYDNDVAGQTTVASSVYELSKGRPWSNVCLSDGQVWPTDLADQANRVRVTFTTAAYDRTNDILHGMFMHFAQLYENRGDSEAGSGASGLDGATRPMERLALRTSGAAEVYDSIKAARI